MAGPDQEPPQDLDTDAEPTTYGVPSMPLGASVSSRRHLEKNPEGENDPIGKRYSFITQLFSETERKMYRDRIETIEKYGRRLDEHCDILMLCSETDQENAGNYCEDYLNKLEMRVNRDGGVKVKAFLLGDLQTAGMPELQGICEALDRCTFVFLYITKDYLENTWSNFIQNMCILDAMKEKKQHDRVVVIHTSTTADYDNPTFFLGLPCICLRDDSKCTKNALSKKLESKLYMRESRERTLVDEKYGALKRQRNRKVIS